MSREDLTIKDRWDEMNHFGRHEFDDPRFEGSGDLMAYDLVKKLDAARERLEAPIMVHKTNKGGVAFNGHSSRSYHYPHFKHSVTGLAVFPPIDIIGSWDQIEVLESASAADIHVGYRKVADKLVPIPYPEQMAVFWLVGFRGIGLYPNWAPCPGWHLDIRPDPLFWIGLDVPTALEGTKREYIYLTA